MPSKLTSPSYVDELDLIAAERNRLQRYLSAELLEALDDPQPGDLLLQLFVHLAAARSTIATYLPRGVVLQLLEERQPSPWLHWVEGSLLFADLSGSTALAEQLSTLGREGTELVTDFLNDIFETMIQAIQAHDGDLVAFGGDALLVYFGDQHHPQTAVRAALTLQEALRGYVKTVPNMGSFPMHLHIGVESGQVAFVSAGTEEARHYSLLGSTVNAVAVAEGLAGLGEVVAGPGAQARLMRDIDGVEVSPGYTLVHGLHGDHALPQPSPDLPPPVGEPLRAIPRILDDLDVLSTYIPSVLHQRIISDPQRPQVEADLRPVTVIFAQVVGLELLAEQLPPPIAANAIQRYVSAMQEAVEQFGGVVNKLDVADEGLKLVAIFGAPTAYEDHPERAARAALAMRNLMPSVQREIEQLLAEIELHEVNGSGHHAGRSPGRQVSLRQRIGLNLGTAFAGNVGSPIRKEYTVMGDAVNVAARVMSKAAWGEVWCSVAAARVIADRMVCEDRGSLVLKGKAAPVRLFHLVAERDTPDVVVSDMGPLVGRERELTWLLGELDAAFAGQGRVVRVVGEAGVGKSRLMAELLTAARRRGMQIIPAACFSYTSGIPYAAWGEWLKALCGIVSGDGEQERTGKLAEWLRDLGDGMEEWLPLLGDLVRLDIPENRLTRGLDPQLRQARRFDLLERLLRRAAARGPVLALFEDLHWADPISIDLWRKVATSISDLPILLVGLHRALPATIDDRDGARVLELRELSHVESEILADHLAGELNLPLPLVGQIIARAAGNPLFLAELLRAVADHYATSPELDSSTLSLDDLPDSLNGLLLSRIDRLDEVSRSVLRIASVIGQRIPFGVLQSIQPVDQRQLIRQLARLDSEEMTVLERVEPERVHTFRHALIQEVAYQSMLYARRRELHGRIGEYLERRYGDDLDDYYGLLAHHYRLSDRRDKAANYLVKAGDAARANYANAEAIQYYRWALEAIDDDTDPASWEARDALAEVYEGIGRYDDALAQHAAIIASPQVEIDIARRAHRKRGSVHEKQGQYSLALDELNRAMELARSGAPISPLALPRTYADFALVRQRLGEYDEAITACEAGLASLRQEGRTRWDDLTEADLHSVLGGIYGMRGDYPRCQYHFERCLQAREIADDLSGVCAVQSNLGYLAQLQSQYEQALEHYRIAEELANKLPLLYVQVVVGVNAADALISLSRYAEAEQRCQAALVLAEQIDAKHMAAQIHHTLGIAFYQQGRYDAALSAFGEALRIQRELGNSYEEANTAIHQALVLSAIERFPEAHEAAQHALARAEELQSQRLKPEALIALAEALLGLAQYEQAEHHARTAADLAEQIGSQHDSGVALRLFGRASMLRGGEFQISFERSEQLLSTINHRFELARTWADYGQALHNSGNLSLGDTYLQRARKTFEAIGAYGELRRLPF